MLNHEITQAFMEPEMRIRVKKGLLKDQIHFGIFENKLLEFINKKEVKIALKEKMIHKEYIKHSSQTRVVYVFLNRECRQVSGFKKVIAKIRSVLRL
jgi:hypothetical protein